MMYKTCPHCSIRLIPYEDKYCSECQEEVDKQRKDKYKKYKSLRIDKKEQDFYCSKEWRQVRDQVLGRYKGLDLYQYYINHKIVYVDIVHHIVELKDINGWERRFNIENLIPVGKGTHQFIHKELYIKDKKGTQELLYSLLDRWKKEFSC